VIGGPLRGPRRYGAPWRHVDVLLVAPTLAIAGIGLLMVYSATRQGQAQAGGDPTFFLERQAIFLAIGLVAMVAVTAFDYRLLRDASPVLWGAAVVTLVLVLSPLGDTTRGAQAWFNVGPLKVEPSEMAKLVLIVCLAAYAADHEGHIEVPEVVRSLLVAAVPMGLILLQPDLGTALVFMAIVMGVLLVAGTRTRHIVALTGLGIVAVVAVFQMGLLQDYQLERLTAFLDPEADIERSAYNLRQSQIAIAAGGIGGLGVFQGPQTNLSYVPEQHTDFIFTAVGEELGFVGAGTLLALFAIVMWRTWRAAVLAKDQFGRLLCVGVLSMLLFQVFENVGMTMGITPITGITLPLVSYGGSSLLATLIGVGLVLNVSMRRYA